MKIAQLVRQRERVTLWYQILLSTSCTILIIRDPQKVFTYYRQQPYVSISKAQQPIKLNYVATYNGIEAQDYPFIVQP
ncbi:hypothetical protein [Anabaena sp. CS-542/02]|uniref:hypothetical protein n=1 Tax=Anabaena sp. CS-542/02 TaxID=3021719 RepID=UPI00232C5ED9|nr:hypothetical protein [Anabaena sp. CS-542/02]MDB9445018.1 hypothetical protein [Anabaena sp. CS-542/02]